MLKKKIQKKIKLTLLIFRRHITVEQQKLKILNLRSSYILTRLVPLVEQELLTLPEHLSSHPVFSGIVLYSIFSFICNIFLDVVCPFVLFSFGHCVICPSLIYGFWLPPLVSSNSSYPSTCNFEMWIKSEFFSTNQKLCRPFWSNITWRVGLWCLMSLSTIFQLYLGGGNQSIWKKALTCRMSLTNFIT